MTSQSTSEKLQCFWKSALKERIDEVTHSLTTRLGQGETTVKLKDEIIQMKEGHITKLEEKIQLTNEEISKKESCIQSFEEKLELETKLKDEELQRKETILKDLLDAVDKLKLQVELKDEELKKERRHVHQLEVKLQQFSLKIESKDYVGDLEEKLQEKETITKDLVGKLRRKDDALQEKERQLREFKEKYELKLRLK